ncbi:MULTISPECIES: hypothetical protein [Pectobacterium]|uniref:Uncharacterized protein n=1 Tax=Pectobacterium aquaticum TaxID=2204145 RepID=A0AA93AQI4_9GAMM|nr:MULTISPECIES: hypothetical protein [Pectobacterium]MDQ5892072.1 hypothetical protein [Pseudomonadota bacterium]KFX00686.1 hypothetical protein JV33_04600 [Pectobacterium carotovorum subsp. carotovorum]KML70273.1 hypothetical protein G032_07925 [Pectobacterium carotovorum subsp. carotovorum ICMP 5702]MBA0175864.1 hypothetical protein [Pectobacterium carotovorum]MCH5052158.1 hypothetical protein [Pectobacterium aquaticum]
MSITSLNGIANYSAPSVNRKEPAENVFSLAGNTSKSSVNSVAANTPSTIQSSKRYDFSNMTPQEAIDATKDLTASGDMSFEESLEIGMAALLILHPPIDDVAPADPNQKINFIQMLKNGISGSLSRGEHLHAEQQKSVLDKLAQLSYMPISVKA